VHTSSQVATIAIALGLGVWSAASSVEPSQPPPTISQSEQTTDARHPPPPAQSQGDQPVYRGGVELIQLDVSVLDRKRQPVTGLSASDFTVFENGVQRPVRAFTSIQLAARRPSAGGAPPTVPVNVVTNQVGQQEGRLVFILMDRTIPIGQPTIAARKIATAAVEALGPHDLAALVSTSGAVPENLTTDRSRLLHAINQDRDWSTGHSKELKDVMTIADDPLRLGDGRCLCGLCVLETLTNIADAVQNAPRRRKVLLFIGSSVIVQAPLRAASADVGCDKLVTDARRRLFDSLALSNLTVHSIDPSGLVTLGPQTRAGTPGGRQGIDGPGSRLLGMQTEVSELLKDQGTLQVLPDLTGGRAISNTNGPAEKIPEIFGETDAYYIIGFEPVTPDQRDGKRRVEVKVARSGVRVNAQRQYMVPAVEKSVVAGGADVPASLEKALRGLLPNASRPLTLSAAAFAGAEKTDAIVMVNVDVGAFANAGEAAMPLDFAVSAINQKTARQVASARETANITFKPGASSRRAEANVQTEIKLTAGDYEVRVAVSDPARGIAASVFCPVNVPLFGSAPLSLSDVIVETTNRKAAGPALAIPVPMATTRRVFEQDEGVRALLQVYQGTDRTAVIEPVSVRTGILDGNGRAIRDQILALTVKDFTNRRAALALDIGQLAPGTYVLSIDASLGRRTASRILSFAVQ